MRLLFVNPVHPDTPHISAVRMWQFACALSSRGHHVALLTPSRDGAPGPRLDRDALARSVAFHDWSRPLHIGLPLPTHSKTDGKRPALLRRMATAWRFLTRGGPNPIWSEAVNRHAQTVTDTLAPDLVWGTFGDSSNITATQALARQAHCPWVLDLKDNWELYVPRGLRHFMVWRTGGWAAITANAEWTRSKARKWQRRDAALIYSGVAEDFLTAASQTQAPDTLDINLIGSLYNGQRLGAVLDGIRNWMDGLPAATSKRVRIHYLGTDKQLFAELATPRFDAHHRVCHGYVDTATMAAQCRGALVNCYIRHEGTFHHKLLELLAVGRPVLAYPSESDESRALARATGGQLLEVNSPEALADTLNRLATEPTPQAAHQGLPQATFSYSWDALADRLEAVFTSVATEAPR